MKGRFTTSRNGGGQLVQHFAFDNGWTFSLLIIEPGRAWAACWPTSSAMDASAETLGEWLSPDEVAVCMVGVAGRPALE